MSTANDEIRARTEAFTADLAELIRRAALEAVEQALGAAQAAVPSKLAAPAKKAAPAKTAPAKKNAAKPAAKAAPAAKTALAPKTAAKAATTPKTTAKKAVAVKRPLGAKRPPAELAALVEKLAGYIQANAGKGVEVIGKALATPTSELALPIKKLIAAKRIRFEGHKRATRYFPV